MDKTTIRIVAQVLENYGCTKEPFQNWKPKGGQEFEVEVDFDIYMYEKETCETVFKLMLAEQSNAHMKFEFLSSEPVFHKPMVLDSAKCFELIKLQAQKPYTT